MTEKRFKLRLSKLGNGMITDAKRKRNDDLYFDKEFLKDTLIKTTDWLNELADENEQLKQLLDYGEDLIYSHLSEHFKRQYRNFKTGHKEYNEFWEQKIKKHNELKRSCLND